MIHEGLLHRVELVAIGKPFDGTDCSFIRLHGKHQAGAYGFAVDDDRACAADPVLAADMRAGLSAIFTDRIDQRAARLDSDRMIAAVDGECDVGLVRSFGLSPAHSVFFFDRKAARMRCGVAGISSMSTPNGESASLIALTTAAGAPMQPPSPRPLAFVIELALGVSM